MQLWRDMFDWHSIAVRVLCIWCASASRSGETALQQGLQRSSRVGIPRPGLAVGGCSWLQACRCLWCAALLSGYLGGWFSCPLQ